MRQAGAVLHKTNELRGYRAREVHVRRPREAIERGPPVDTADTDPAESVPALWIM